MILSIVTLEACIPGATEHLWLVVSPATSSPLPPHCSPTGSTYSPRTNNQFFFILVLRHEHFNKSSLVLLIRGYVIVRTFVSVFRIKSPWCLNGEDTEHMYSKHISV